MGCGRLCGRVEGGWGRRGQARRGGWRVGGRVVFLFRWMGNASSVLGARADVGVCVWWQWRVGRGKGIKTSHTSSSPPSTIPYQTRNRASSTTTPPSPSCSSPYHASSRPLRTEPANHRVTSTPSILIPTPAGTIPRREGSHARQMDGASGPSPIAGQGLYFCAAGLAAGANGCRARLLRARPREAYMYIEEVRSEETSQPASFLHSHDTVLVRTGQISGADYQSKLFPSAFICLFCLYLILGSGSRGRYYSSFIWATFDW